MIRKEFDSKVTLPIEALDAMWANGGVQSTPAKAFDREIGITALGVDLIDGVDFRARSQRLL